MHRIEIVTAEQRLGRRIPRNVVHHLETQTEADVTPAPAWQDVQAETDRRLEHRLAVPVTRDDHDVIIDHVDLDVITKHGVGRWDHHRSGPRRIVDGHTCAEADERRQRPIGIGLQQADHHVTVDEPDVDVAKGEVLVEVIEVDEAIEAIEEEIAELQVERTFRVRTVRPQPEPAVAEPVLELGAGDPARLQRQVGETEAVDEVRIQVEDLLEQELVVIVQVEIAVVVQVAEPDTTPVEGPGTPVVLCRCGRDRQRQ